MPVTIKTGDCRDVLRTLDADSVHCCVTSPPYFGLRDYGHPAQLGLEKTPEEYVDNLVGVFAEVHRVLRNDGVCWLNIGDGYAGYWGDAPARREGRPSQADRRGFSMNSRPSFHEAFGVNRIKPKDLIGIPWKLAFALRDFGWYLRQEVIWHKPNHAPEGKAATSRFTRCTESVFLLAKSYRHYFNSSGRQRNVLSVPVARGGNGHSATFPEALIEPLIHAGCPVGGTVLDPFAGTGTTGLVADRMGRNALLIELNPAYVETAQHFFH